MGVVVAAVVKVAVVIWSNLINWMLGVDICDIGTDGGVKYVYIGFLSCPPP